MKTTEKQLKDIITLGMKKEIKDYELYQKVRNILVSFNEKVISKRMKTAVEKEFPNWTICYSTDYGMFHIKMWEHNYNDQHSFLLGYNTSIQSKIFSLESFDEYNARYSSAAIARNINRKSNLRTVKTLSKVINNYLIAKKNLKDAMDTSVNYPDYYEILKAAGIESKKLY